VIKRLIVNTNIDKENEETIFAALKSSIKNQKSKIPPPLGTIIAPPQKKKSNSKRFCTFVRSIQIKTKYQ
jgi:hypothetical protein